MELFSTSFMHFTNIRNLVFSILDSRYTYANPKLVDESNKRVGNEPAPLFDLHIADLSPSAPNPNREDTSTYRVTDRDENK